MKTPHLNTEKMDSEGIPMEVLSGQEDPCPGGDFEQENRETVGAKEIPEQAPLVQEGLLHGGDPGQENQEMMEAEEILEQAPLNQGNFGPDEVPEQGNKKDWRLLETGETVLFSTVKPRPHLQGAAQSCSGSAANQMHLKA